MTRWYFGNQGESGVSVQTFGNRTVITVPNQLTIVATGGSVSFTPTRAREQNSPSGRRPRFQGYRDFREGNSWSRNRRRRARGRGRGYHHPGPRGPVHANGTTITDQSSRSDPEQQGRNNSRQQRLQGGAQGIDVRAGNRNAETTHTGTGTGLISRAIASASASAPSSASAPMNVTAGSMAGQMSVSASAPGSGFGVGVGGQLSSAGPDTGSTYTEHTWTSQGHGALEQRGQLVVLPPRPRDYASVGRDYVHSQHPGDEDEEWKIDPAALNNGYDGGLELDVSEEVLLGGISSTYLDLTEIE
ncbi:uncharacterized protein BDV17DRAFT_207707 [Aspergillus undulatus]|uniref:uncharacterized protein n=1 Tax=Aspergillus undulatus TaxID=1810928 RepID=UPI003CCC96E1